MCSWRARSGNSLPEGVRKILAANSGEAESRAFGHFWDEVVQEGHDTTMKLPGHTALHLTDAEEKSWHDRIAPIADDWAKSMPDGDKILSTYSDLLAKVKAGS